MEASEMKRMVFVSYSHEDAYVITKIVALLKFTRADFVFQDSKDIGLGKRWEEEIFRALDEAHIFIIFWCRHAKESAYIQKEYSRALSQGKEILPVLLDSTPLTEPLRAYQWLDFRRAFIHEPDHDTSSDFMNPKSHRRFYPTHDPAAEYERLWSIEYAMWKQEVEATAPTIAAAISNELLKYTLK